MKKSKHIQLVLITAAFASCNRAVMPRQQPQDIAADSTLIAAPVYDDSTYAENYSNCSCEDVYPTIVNSFSPYGSFYLGPINNYYYYSGRRHANSTVLRAGKLIVRGGFGKISGSAAS